MRNNNSQEQLVKQLNELQSKMEELKRTCGRSGGLDGNLLSPQLFDENPLMLFVIDDKGIVSAVNRRGGTQLGYDPRELTGRSVLTVFHPDDRQAAWDHVAESLSNPDKTLSWELRKVRKDGTVIWVKEFARPITVADGSVRLYIACEDITEAKRLEDALRQSEERYRDLVQNANSIILKIDTEGAITFFNEFAQTFFGFSADEIIGRNPIGTIAPETESSGRELRLMLRKVLKAPEHYAINENENIKKNGERVWVSWRNKVIYDQEGHFTGILAVGQDITEHKHAEEALARSEAEFKAIFNSLHDAAIFADTDRHIRLVNPAFTAQFGYTFDEVRGKTTNFLYVNPADFEELGKKRYNTGAEAIHKTFAVQYRRKDGTRFWSETSGIQVRDAHGAILGFAGISRDITERKQAEEALRISEDKYRTLFNSMDEGFCIVQLIFDNAGKPVDFRFIEINPAFEKQTGMKDVVGRSIREVLPEVEPLWFVLYGNVAVSRKPRRYEGYVESLGRWFDVYAFPRGEADERKVAVVFRDITGRKRMENRLERSKALSDELNRINMLVHSTLDTTSVMMRALEGAETALGVDAATVGIFENGPSKDLSIRYFLNIPDHLKDLCCSPEEARGIQYVAQQRDAAAFNDIAADERVNSEFWTSFGYSSLLAAPLITRNEVIGTIMFFSSRPFLFEEIHIDFARKMAVSLSLAVENAGLYEQRVKMEEEMRHMAHHDPLTGLPNRRLFLDLLQLEREQANRNQKKMALFFLDLDRFKEVNDTLGHDVGNRLLKEVSVRLKSLLRRSDTIARIGGDEFNIILADLARPENAAEVARNIIASFRKPFRISGHELNLTTSIGISISPDDSADIDTLLRYSDIAMYHAKQLGRNRYQFYNSSINVKSLERMRLEAMLKRSLEFGEMEIYFQPLVDIRSRRVVCGEALARWHHPEKGLLLPKDFVPAAEETGFISELGEWSLKTVCSQMRTWLDAGTRPIRLTVNLSPRQFQDPELIDKIALILKDTAISPRDLGVEITESMAMADVERSAERMKKLRGMGIEVSIDDFGTGYSSLNYLKKLPIERLKIDMSFIQDIVSDPDDRSIVQAVTAMAHNMKMKVVAEGVETEEQLEFLSRTGCDEMQGFLFSKPLPAREFEELLKAA